MKVAVLSDIHGNMPALEATLADIAAPTHVDQIVCGGDIPNPFLRLARCLAALLKVMGIPILRGNHEDYIVSYFSGDRPEIRRVNPVHCLIQLVAHATWVRKSRANSRRSPLTTSSPARVATISIFATHHLNTTLAVTYEAWMTRWPPSSSRSARAQSSPATFTRSGKGSGRDAISLSVAASDFHTTASPKRSTRSLTHRQGHWHSELKRKVPYDQAAALKEYRESPAFIQGGPIAWLLYDELLCCEARLALFLPKVLSDAATRPVTLADWAREVEQYLHQIGHGPGLRPLF